MRMDRIHKATLILLVVFLLAGSWPAPAHGAQLPGSGTANDPYQIATAEDLVAMHDFCNCNHHFVLTADIDMDGIDWTPIGTASSPFKGTFDGQNHTIHNLTIGDKGLNDYGLFGYVEDSTIQNVQLDNVQFHVTESESNSRGGALAGRTARTEIRNVEVTGTIQSSLHYTGGVVGQLMAESVLRDSKGDLMIASTWNQVGGLVGSVDGDSSIVGSSFTGSVQGVSIVGGIAGYVNGTVEDTTSNANVIGTGGTVGGLAGNLHGSITNVTVQGAVYGESFVGGLAGQLNDAHIVKTNIDVNKVQLAIGEQLSLGKLAGYSFGTHVFSEVWINPNMVILDVNSQPLDPASLWGIHEAPDTPSTGNFQGGDGSGQNPYLIATPEQLDAVRHLSEGGYHFKLVNDIDLSSYLANQPEGWTPIGSVQQPFEGLFDGNGHTIYGLRIYNNNLDNPQGLFSVIKQATIINVHLQDVDIDVDNQVGALVGQAMSSMIAGVSASGTVKTDNYNAGGLVGVMNGQSGPTTLKQAISWVDVTGTYYVGGAVGETVGQTELADIKSYGYVTGDVEVGGLVGTAKSDTVVKRVKSYGNVYGDYAVGGLIGYWSQGTIDEARVYGSVHGSDFVGGLFGYLNIFTGITDTITYGKQIVRTFGDMTTFGRISGNGHMYMSDTVAAHPYIPIMDETSGTQFEGDGYDGEGNYETPFTNSADLATAGMLLDGQPFDREENALTLHWGGTASSAVLAIHTTDPHARIDIDVPYIRELPYFDNPGETRFRIDNPGEAVFSFQVAVVSEDTLAYQFYDVTIAESLEDDPRLHIINKLNLSPDTRLNIQHIMQYVLAGPPYFLGITELDVEALGLLLTMIDPLHPVYY